MPWGSTCRPSAKTSSKTRRRWLASWAERALGAMLAPNKNTSNTALAGNYLTLMLKDPSSSHLTLKGANAQSGMLAVKYDGNRPNGFSPQKKQGSVELGVGGDGSSGSMGTFFEGA